MRTAGRSAAAGFTLIELAVVMLLLVIILGMVGVNLTRGPSDVVRDEGQRLALLLQTAQQEAILEGRFYAFAVNPNGYEFLRLDDSGKLAPVSAGDPLGPRALPGSMTLELVDQTRVTEDDDAPLILFDPSGALARFTIVLQAQEAVWYVEATRNGRIHSAPTPERDEA
jgi:general secretion pathway protein H